jgi:hypothetical protein
MESKGYLYNGKEFLKVNGKITAIVSIKRSLSEYCYNNGEYWNDENGKILNELGRPAKDGDIVMRDYPTGYPIKRMGKNGIYNSVEVK